MKKRLNRVRGASLALALACAAGAEAGIRVLIVGDGNPATWLEDVRSKLAGALPGPGNVVDTFNNDGGGTPTLALLKTYDVVFAYTDGGVDDSVALGNVLADYVDAGGNVVEATFGYFTTGIGIQGRWQTGGYKAMQSTGQTASSTTIGTRQISSHEILAGVNTLTATFRNTGAPAAGVTRVADFADGNPMVMTVPGKNGRIASLNFYPPSDGAAGQVGFWDDATDGARLMANACTWAAGNNVDVLILGAPTFGPWLDEVQSTLRNFGRVGGRIDTFNIQVGTPTASQLAGYDTVLVTTDFPPQNPTLLGDLLADYVDAGGGVVASTFSGSSFFGLRGRFVSGGYTPLASGNIGSGALTLGTISVPNHPLMRGVTTFSGGSSSFHTTGPLTPGSTLVASWSNGQPLIATKKPVPSGGRVVALNFYPPSSLSRADFWDVATDGGAILGNAVTWSARNDNDVLLYVDLNTGTMNDVISKIQSSGQIDGTISVRSTNIAAASLPFLKRFDSVFIATDFPPAEPELLGDVLSYYVDAGGGVVDTLGANSGIFGVTGRWLAGQYSGITNPIRIIGPIAVLGQVFLPRHPTMFRVAAFDGGGSSIRVPGAARPGAVEIARWSDGLPLVIENSGKGNGRVVTLNFFPSSSDFNPTYWDSSTDGVRLMTNALNHVAQSDTNVLLAGSFLVTELDDLRGRIAATGRIRDGIEQHQILLDAALPAGLATAYDTVLFGVNTRPDTITLGNQLADHVDAGGGVVTMTGAHAPAPFGLSGRWASGGYSPYPIPGTVLFTSNPVLGTIRQPGHPVLSGVDSFNGGNNALLDAASVLPNAEPIAHYNIGNPLAAERKNGPIQTVGLNFFMPSDAVQINGWEASTDGAILITNALTYVAAARPCYSDFNGDGFVDFFDFDDFVNCFEGFGCPPGATADFNGDGFVDFFDYDDFVAAFERGC